MKRKCYVKSSKNIIRDIVNSLVSEWNINKYILYFDITVKLNITSQNKYFTFFKFLLLNFLSLITHNTFWNEDGRQIWCCVAIKESNEIHIENERGIGLFRTGVGENYIPRNRGKINIICT